MSDERDELEERVERRLFRDYRLTGEALREIVRERQEHEHVADVLARLVRFRV